MLNGHDLRILQRGAVCVRCFFFARDPDSPAPPCREASVHHLPADARRDGSDAAAAACGANGGLLAVRVPVSCPACIDLLREDARRAEPGAQHDLRFWDRAALCVACGAFSADPMLLGPCTPLVRPADSRICLAGAAEGREGTPACGREAFAASVEQPFPRVREPAWAVPGTGMLSGSLANRTHGRADCPDCLGIAAASLAPYRAAHDVRVFGDGAACADCGAFAAISGNLGECDRGYALAVAARRRALPRIEHGSRSRTLLWIGMPAAAPVHAAGGCGRGTPALRVRRGALLSYGRARPAARITCKFCLRAARKSPAAPGAAAAA